MSGYWRTMKMRRMARCFTKLLTNPSLSFVEIWLFNTFWYWNVKQLQIIVDLCKNKCIFSFQIPIWKCDCSRWSRYYDLKHLFLRIQNNFTSHLQLVSYYNLTNSKVFNRAAIRGSVCWWTLLLLIRTRLKKIRKFSLTIKTTTWTQKTNLIKNRNGEIHPLF